MQLIRHLNTDLDDPRSSAVAVGNFDGLHRGHQALLHAALEAGSELVPSVMCFEPLPRTFFCPERPVPRLMSVRDRALTAEALGIQRMFVLRFNREFSAQTPKVFARNVLARGARARLVIVGPDFRFGHKAAGDVAALEAFGEQYGFRVQVVAPVGDNGNKISSSAIRAALAAGDLRTAQELLGSRYRISGRVRRGNRLGRELGFPTVNLRVAEPPAAHGIFAVRVTGTGLENHPGVASLGRRPAVAGNGWLLEAHLFDFDRELYGEHLTVEFIDYIRPEEDFASLEAMRRQMEHDAGRAREILDREK